MKLWAERPDCFANAWMRAQAIEQTPAATVARSRALRAAVDSGRYGDWLRMLLEHAEGCQLTLTDAASALQIGSHTLARRLASEGLEFRELSNEVRMRRAVVMLSTSQASIAEVATRLGYKHTSNFTSAFRLHTGTSPRKYRQLLKNRSLEPSG